MQYWVSEKRILCADGSGIHVGIMKKGVLKLKAVNEIRSALDDGRSAEDAFAQYCTCKPIALDDLERIELRPDGRQLSFIGRPEYTLYEANSTREAKEICKQLSDLYDLKFSDRRESVLEASKGPAYMLLLVVVICGLLTFVSNDPGSLDTRRVGRGAGLAAAARNLGLDGMLLASFVAVIAVAAFWGFEVLLRDRTRIFTPQYSKRRHPADS